MNADIGAPVTNVQIFSGKAGVYLTLIAVLFGFTNHSKYSKRNYSKACGCQPAIITIPCLRITVGGSRLAWVIGCIKR